MLTITDIPDEYRTGQTAGENITLFASGVTTAIHEAEGDRGSEALRRFGQAGFLFRSGEIGQAMVRSSSALSQPLGETPQLVDFGGGALAASALSGAVDLAAATLCRLFVGQPFARDPDREADVDHFPGEDQLPPAAKDWLEETRTAPEWLWLKSLRCKNTGRSPGRCTGQGAVRPGELGARHLSRVRTARCSELTRFRTEGRLAEAGNAVLGGP